MSSDVVSIKIRGSKVVKIKGVVDGAIEDLVRRFAKKVSRGYIEIHGGDIFDALKFFFEKFPQPSGFIRDSYFLFESYRARIGLFLLYRSGKLVLMTNGDFITNDRFYEFVEAFFNKINTKTEIFRFCVVDSSALSRSLDILRKISINSHFEIQIDLMGATILNEMPSLLEQFNKIYVFKDQKGFISIKRPAGKIEIYSDSIEINKLVEIMRITTTMTRFVSSIDLDLTDPNFTSAILEILQNLLKDDIDYVYISSRKISFEKNETYVILLPKATIVNKDLLSEAIKKSLDLLSLNCPATIHLDGSNISIEKMGPCRD